MMGTVLLLRLDEGLAAELARKPPPLGDSRVEIVDGDPEAVSSLARRARSLDALVVGTGFPDPVTLAQRVQQVDRDLSVLILASPTAQDDVRRALQFAPNISGDVRCLTAVDALELAHEVAEAVELTRKRRSHRETLSALNRQLTQVRPPPSQEVVSLGRLLDMAPVGVAAVDRMGRVLAWNRRAEVIFERPASEALGQPFASVLSEPAQRENWERLLGQAASLEAPTSLKLERPRPNGVVQHVEVTVAPLATDAGTGLLLLFQDVTERILGEQERTALLRQTQHALAVRDEFLTVASHELRTPLTSLRLVIQSLMRDVEAAAFQPEIRDAVERKVTSADRQIVRLTRLVEGLLDVSSVQSGRLRLERTVVDLEAVIQRAISELDDHRERAGCTFDVKLRGPIRGAWDERRLQQVLMSLLSNALRYAPGTTIEITAQIENGQAILEVTDHGIGIDPTDLDRIFDRFERAVPARNYGGLGLGLFISRKIVEAHGGAITATSRPGQGARFRVQLPMRPTL